MGRASGILLHITSLPNGYGLGCFSSDAFDFIDFLKECKCKNWQLLPLNPCDYGASPYDSCSAFAGNPYLIDLTEFLIKDELEALGIFEYHDKGYLIFSEYQSKFDSALKLVYKKQKSKTDTMQFYKQNQFWLEDYALFMTIRSVYKIYKLSDFPAELKNRDKTALKNFIEQHRQTFDFYVFIQYLFFKQWTKIKNYANAAGIKIIGDLPFYVNLNSADVWANKELFLLDDNFMPTAVSAVPPDYFSEKGQIWNNPVYNIEYAQTAGYKWWIDRFNHLAKLYDKIRLDHFRGYSEFYCVKNGAIDAKKGKWIKGLGKAFFDEVKAKTKIELFAEDLGYFDETSKTHELLKHTGLAGLKVLQFAFDDEYKSAYLPHNYEKNCVAYIGTHDNDTYKGFLQACGYFKLNKIKNYFGVPIKAEINDVIDATIQAMYMSSADTVIFTMQDLLTQESYFRMNTPNVISGCWRYQINRFCLKREIAEKLSKYAYLYDR